MAEKEVCLQGAERWRDLIQPEEAKRGMCMAVQLFSRPAPDTAAEGQQEQGLGGNMEQAECEGQLHAAVGYEDGSIAVWDVALPSSPIMACRLHSEPVMALAIDPAGTGASPVLMWASRVAKGALGLLWTWSQQFHIRQSGRLCIAPIF